MTAAETPPKLSPIERVKQFRNYFLASDIPVSEQPEAYQKALTEICGFLDTLSPYGLSEMTITTPSEALISYGLVSDETGNRIQRRVERRNGKGDLNVLTIRKVDDGYTLTEIYTSELHGATIIDQNPLYAGEIRRDITVEEVTHLQKGQDGTITAKIMGKTSGAHIHAPDGRYVRMFLTHPEEEQGKELEVTPSRINTTLALFIEGLTGRRNLHKH